MQDYDLLPLPDVRHLESASSTGCQPVLVLVGLAPERIKDEADKAESRI